MKIGDKVKVVGAESIPSQFIGMTGTVKKVYPEKVMVELIPRKGSVGSLSHTAIFSDLEVIETTE